MEQINKKIKELREHLGLTQGEFAGLVDITSGHLSMIEAGKRSPSIDLFTRICETFHITPNSLSRKNGS